MKARNGQVALYLVAVLVAIAILIFMNVDVFLAVRAKNHATAAGDAAAIAVARYQGELLNQVGEDNIELLKAALKNDLQECRAIVTRQRRRIFLDPLEGIRIGSDAAETALSGCETGGGDDPEAFESSAMKKLLAQHVFEVRGIYAADTELYPEPWKGAWEEYATRLELAIGGEVYAGPENAEFASAYQCFPLLSQEFYNAIAGEMWCWFKWNGEWLFDCDSHNMPRPVYPANRRRDNSEIYSLHLQVKALPPVLDTDWRKLIMSLAECSEEELKASWLLTNGVTQLAFFDSRWSSWTESGFSIANGFPLVGDVKPEYDVYGCAALCRVSRGGYQWTAAAKPFGTVRDLDDELAVVTALKKLVTPAFTDSRLVPIDSVGGRDLHTADWDWMVHIRNHIPSYLEYGPFGGNCWYCQQLTKWENPVFRSSGRRWLKYNSADCIRPSPGGISGHGGTAHAH